MTQLETAPRTGAPSTRGRWAIGSEAIAVAVLVLLVVRFLLGGGGLTDEAVRTWSD